MIGAEGRFAVGVEGREWKRAEGGKGFEYLGEGLEYLAEGLEYMVGVPGRGLGVPEKGGLEYLGGSGRGRKGKGRRAVSNSNSNPKPKEVEAVGALGGVIDGLEKVIDGEGGTTRIEKEIGQ